MEEISKLLKEVLNIDFIRAVISNPVKKEGIIKVKVRPVETKGELHFQLESFTKTQAFHENLGAADAEKRILEYMEAFRQMQIETVNEECTVLVSKKARPPSSGRNGGHRARKQTCPTTGKSGISSRKAYRSRSCRISG